MSKLLAISVLIVSVQGMAQTSFWPKSTIPSTQQAADTGSVNLGIRFYSTQSGFVTGVRFYKGWQNTGTHVGTLWSGAGTKLASVTFSGETTSGWQQANFSAPVAITANTIYVMSYLAPKGAYAIQQDFPWSGLSSGSLRPAGSYAGVYTYGSYTAFPTSWYRSSNYYVDIVFASSTITSPTLPSTTYTISGTVSGSAATIALSGPATGSKATDSTGKYSFSGLPNGVYVLSANNSGYVFSPSTAQVTINGASATGVNFAGTASSPTTTRSVSLSWAASTTQNVRGYNVYRADVAGGTYVKRNASLVGTTAFAESVTSGRTYYYVATAVDGNNVESTYSNRATAVVP